MADMARVLVSYHFGGIYMDLDFYCHRPFRCLVQRAQKQWQTQTFTQTGASASNSSSTAALPRDVLVVAREPLAHAVLFRKKTRVVIQVGTTALYYTSLHPRIFSLFLFYRTFLSDMKFHRLYLQDFFLATPRHPFLHWLLEDRLQLFLRSRRAGAPDSNNSSNNISANASEAAVFPKGPFSYSIERDIDRYRSSVPAAGAGDEAIIELAEDVLHPLIDATNSRLASECANHRSAAGESMDPLSAAREQVCRAIQQRVYFAPSSNTVLVHMWTHVYLGERDLSLLCATCLTLFVLMLLQTVTGWSFVRGLYNAWTYSTVQSALPPTDQC